MSVRPSVRTNISPPNGRIFVNLYCALQYQPSIRSELSQKEQKDLREELPERLLRFVIETDSVLCVVRAEVEEIVQHRTPA